MQDFIAAADKDFARNFNNLVILATIVPYQYVPSFNNDGVKFTKETVDEDVLEEIRESFLDDVFDTKAKLLRTEYL